jgi:hypothetical protein
VCDDADRGRIEFLPQHRKKSGQTWNASSTGTPMKAKISRPQSAMRSWRIGKIAMSAA